MPSTPGGGSKCSSTTAGHRPSSAEPRPRERTWSSTCASWTPMTSSYPGRSRRTSSTPRSHDLDLLGGRSSWTVARGTLRLTNVLPPFATDTPGHRMRTVHHRPHQHHRPGPHPPQLIESTRITGTQPPNGRGHGLPRRRAMRHANGRPPRGAALHLPQRRRLRVVVRPSGTVPASSQPPTVWTRVSERSDPLDVDFMRVRGQVALQTALTNLHRFHDGTSTVVDVRVRSPPSSGEHEDVVRSYGLDGPPTVEPRDRPRRRLRRVHGGASSRAFSSPATTSSSSTARPRHFPSTSRSASTLGRDTRPTTRGGARSLLEWADVILCEWLLGNAVWYARHRATTNGWSFARTCSR